MKANVSEIFYSVQGEGTTIGAPAIFIRFCGCNLSCPFCDTKYAINCRNILDFKAIYTIVSKFPAKRIIFTGGEPVLHDEFISYFIEEKPNYYYQIETNGTIYPENSIKKLDHVVVSPKMFAVDKHILVKLKENARSIEFKFVVDENFDKELELIDELKLENIVFQPVWNNETREQYLAKTRAIIEKVKQIATGIRVIPQLHKILYGFKRGI